MPGSAGPRPAIGRTSPEIVPTCPLRAGSRAALPAAALLSLVALVALVASVAPAAAQGPPDGSPPGPDAEDPAEGYSRVFVEAGPGLLAPLADLAPGETGDASVEPDPAPSLSIAVSARAGAVYLLSPSIGVALHGAWARPDVDLQPVLGGGADDGARRLGTADYLAAAGEVVYRPLSAPGGSVLDPYLAAGAGVRHLSFSDDALEGGTDPLGTVAGGVRTAVSGPFYWSLEVRGYFSSADPTSRGSRFQNDVLVTVGIGSRL